MKYSLLLLAFAWITPSFAAPKKSVKENINPDSVFYAWKLTDDFLSYEKVPNDTDYIDFNQYNPALANNEIYSYNGNLGSPIFKNDVFYHNFNQPDFIFFHPLAPYIHNIKNTLFYNTLKPFSNISYISSLGSKSKLEQKLSFLHTQNVNEHFNVGFFFDNINSEGQYLTQLNKIVNIGLFSSYNSQHYDMNSCVNINSINIQQNGGIDIDHFNNPDFLDIDTKYYSRYLTDAKSKFRNRNIFFTHRYKFGQKIHRYTVTDTIKLKDTVFYRNRIKKEVIHDNRFAIRHSFAFDEFLMNYTDNAPIIDNYNYIYDTIGDTNRLQNSFTFDSAFKRTYTNSVFLEILDDENSIFPFGAIAGIRNENNRYGFVEHPFGPFIHKTLDISWYYNNYYSLGLFKRSYGRYRWSVTIDRFFEGYGKGDYLYSGKMRTYFDSTYEKEYLDFSLFVKKNRPDMAYQKYQSNHIMWDSAFRDMSSQGLHLGYTNKTLKFEIGLNYSDNEKYIYFDTLYRPVQYKLKLSLFDSYIKKRFDFWKITSIHKLDYQRISNKTVLSLPDFNYTNTTYLEQDLYFKVTEGHMKIQLGFNLYYFNEYKAYSYMPAINQFYQANLSLGNYPYLDVFLNLKIKRALLFFKVDHLNSDWIGRDYIMVWHYPMNRRAVKFGITWNFYN